MRSIIGASGARFTHPMLSQAVVLAGCLLFAASVEAQPQPEVADSAAINGEQPAAADGNAPAAVDGAAAGATTVHLIQVPLPIRGTIDQQVQQTIEQIWQDHPLEAGDRRVLVLEFRPKPGGDPKASQFERSLALARYLTGPELRRVRTVAYLPSTVRGHAVLPVLACEQIVMDPDAELGDANAQEAAVDPGITAGYREIVDRRGTLPWALVEGMLDKSAEVFLVTTANGNQVRLQGELEELRQREVVHNVQTIKPAGQVGIFAGRKLRLDWQLISQLAADRRQLAAAVGVAPEQLESDVSLSEGWRAIRADLIGPMHAALATRTRQALEHGITDLRANLVVLYLDSPGGDPKASLELAQFLIGLRKDSIRTVCYVSRQARGDAALVAWAADQLIVSPDAVLGGPGAASLTDEQLGDLKLAIQELAKGRGRPWSVPLALIDGRVSLQKYVRQGTGVAVYLTEEEAAEVAGDGSWTAAGAVGKPGEPLELTGESAVQLRLARHTAADMNELAVLYGLEGEPELVRSKWAYELIDSLARPEVAATLLFLGGFALMIELSSPGLGVGGFLSAVCFILYFWSNFLHGTAAWLEIVLFVVGLLFVLIEVFVLPGFGIFGLGGGLMMIAALVLASQTFVLPTNEYQMRQLPKSIGIVSAGAVGLMVGVFLLGRYLDRLPMFRQFALPTPEGTERVERSRRESLANFDGLIGEVGIVTTPLRPAGKVRFGTRLVDVVSDGEAMEVGESVRVQSVDGTRVVVGRVTG
ncbi:MAG: NfeD family protein [Pirellulales bacterium]